MCIITDFNKTVLCYLICVVKLLWAEKHKIFLAPIRRQNGGDRLELVW